MTEASDFAAIRHLQAPPGPIFRSVKILQIVSGREVNGALVYAKALAERLRREGHDVTLMARRESWLERQPLTVPLICSNMNRLPPTDLLRTARMIQRERFDIVHTHMSRANHFGVFLRLLTRVPTIATCHAPRLHPQWHFHDLVIANSAATHDFLRYTIRVPSRRLETIHCFVDLERFLNTDPRHRLRLRRELHVDDGAHEFLVGVIGGVIPRKGQEVLVHALPQILEEVPHARVAFIGRFHRDESYVKRIRRFILRHRLMRRIKWLGIRNNVNEYLQALDLTVIPSLKEPLGLVAIESQAAGIPVVASAVGGLTEIVDHDKTGWLVPPDNPSALAAAVIAAAYDAERRAQMATHARQTVQERFAPEVLTRMVEQTYERLLASQRARLRRAA